MTPPAWTRSIRFRLTVIYSLALFVLGAVAVGVTYAGLRSALDDEPVSATLIRNQAFPLRDGGILFTQEQQLIEYTSLETLVNERALDQLRRYSFAALGAMFVTSLGVGWIVAGRALRPIARIGSVARDITATDLSRRIDLEGPDDELTRLADTFDDMLSRLDRSFESQRRFIHEASHELRNPLATMRTNLEVALADPDASVDELRQTAEIVDRSAQRMGRVVDDLLAFARSDVPEIEQGLVDLGALVEEVAEEFSGTAEAAAVDIGIDVEPGLVVRGDGDGLRRAVANLVANAIEHAPSGTSVEIEARTQENRVRIEVEDRGPGVAEDELELVFERSWRGAASTRRRPSGSGLGLTIVRQVARTHGGDAWVEPGRDGTGACFVVDIESH